MEHHAHEVNMTSSDSQMCFQSSLDKLNDKMRETLSEEHFTVYQMLFLEQKNEDDVALFMGYKTSEKNRKAGYKQIKNLKKMLRNTAVAIIEKNDITP